MLSLNNHPTKFDDTRRSEVEQRPRVLGSSSDEMTAAIALIIGVADFTWPAGDLTFTGIALGSIATLLVCNGMRLLGLRSSRRGEQHGG